MKYLILSKKIWSQEINKSINKNYSFENKLNIKKINKQKPKIIFFVFWSEYIPKKIYEKFLCIQFHTSDLPKFRGGSPIQNQIINKVYKSKISAFKVNSILDSGDICLKRKIELKGSAEQIFINIEKKAFDMIKFITRKKRIRFTKQKGRASYYKRRKPEDSNLNKYEINNLIKFFDLIRSTDAPGYPSAYLNFKNFYIEIFNAKMSKQTINARIKISKKK